MHKKAKLIVYVFFVKSTNILIKLKDHIKKMYIIKMLIHSKIILFFLNLII